jgi:hypothetical protein
VDESGLRNLAIPKSSIVEESAAEQRAGAGCSLSDANI